MAVQLEDLLEPEGPLEYVYFGIDEADGAAVLALEDKLERYIARGVAKVAAYPSTLAEPDVAVRAYALHLAFSALYLQRVSNPASSSMDDVGSASYAADQRKAFKEQADRYLQEYEALAPPVPTGTVVLGSDSVAVPTRYVW